MNSLAAIDSNIISVLILGIVYIASISISLNKLSKKSYFNYLVFVTLLMLVLQSSVKLISNNPDGVLIGLLNPLKFIFAVLIPILPAIWSLYITSKKNPRLLKDKWIVILFFIPAIINLIFVITGIAIQAFTILLSMVPVIFTIYIVVKFNCNDTKTTNIAYIAYIFIAALVSLNDTLGLAGVSMSILALFLSDELSAFRMDALTKISNRKHLYDHIERMTKHKKHFTLIMLDLDKLKDINDTYGHVTGDEAIVTATSIIKSQIRQNDFFARYAGDEFMIVLDSCDRYTVRSFLSRIDRSFSSFNEESRKKYSLSVSFGYYINEECITNVTELIEKADENMFKNKRKKLVKNWQKNIQLVSVHK